MTPPPLDTISVADMCVDLVLTGNVRPEFQQIEQLIGDYRLELGGSAAIFASQFAKLGGRPGVIGRVGRDPFGEFALNRLRAIGVDTSRVEFDEHAKTGLGVALSVPGDRAILTYAGTIDAVGPEALFPSLLECCRHWHIASYFLLSKLRPFWKPWLESCRKAGVSTSLDTNWDPGNQWQSVFELLPLVDVFIPNRAEALAIAGERDVDRAGRRLAGTGNLIVVKLGGEGAVAFRGGRRWAARAQPVDTIADATGAGDNFDAGFLHGWLLGWEIDGCLELASRCGAASLGALGGIEGQLIGTTR